MIGVIARKELLELWRDGRFRVVALVLLALLVAAELLGWRNYVDLSRQAQQASHDERERWLSQGNKYPHAAAHYGVFAFKAPRPLSILDSGIQPYVGTSVWLEAHKQNEMLYRPAEDATALQRFGDLNAAGVGQVLLPLLIIFMAFPAFAGEREEGTLKQLVLLGLSPYQLLLGKAAGQAAALSIVLVPAFLLTLTLVGVLAPAGTLADELIRALGFAVVYAVYFGGFLFFTLAVSARCSSSKAALLIALAFWALAVLVLPRFLLDSARMLYPTQPALELKHALNERLAETAAEKLAASEAALLKEYGVTRKEDLPIPFEGLALQSDEEAKYALFEQHYGTFFDAVRRQDFLFQLGTLIAPTTGLQLLSMALTGSDIEHHRDFVLQGEANRRVIHTMINEFMVKHSARNADGEWEVEAGRELWERIPPFEYRPPGWRFVLPTYWPSLGLLVLWAASMLGYAVFAVGRLWTRRADQ
ncbi:MAG: DUF3526 domain-containing protein [Gammaproteobacteria bacterium]|nr:DUF3526 domain-containing protein [Gammaproteobacteria bacterium]